MIRRLIRIFENVLDQVKKRISPLHIVDSNPNPNEIKRFLDGEDRRHYQKNGHDVYSTTTVLEELGDKENEGLKWWKKHNDGEGDNPDWKHILEYKQNRGTLAHHAALSQHYEQVHGSDSQLWSDDETESLYQVMDKVGDPDFLYSIMADRDWVETEEAFENVLSDRKDNQLDKILTNDLEYFTEEYDKIAEKLGINADTVEQVEEMFVVPPNHEHDGYGGQVDLIYRDPTTGEPVVADLKTSSAVRDKHKYQAAAYATAVQKLGMYDTVARGEIIRINPDNEEVEVYEVEDFSQYWSEFAETTKKM